MALAGIDRDPGGSWGRLVFAAKTDGRICLDCCREQVFDGIELLRSTWAIQLESLPTPNPRHQFDSQQECQAKNVRRLTVRVSMQTSGVQVRQRVSTGTVKIRGATIGVVGNSTSEHPTRGRTATVSAYDGPRTAI